MSKYVILILVYDMGSNMKKIVKLSLIVIYSLVVVLTTGYLLTFNEYNISEIGNKTILTNQLDGFKKNSLIIINKSKATVDDEVIFYDSYKGYKISKNKVTTVYNNDKDTYLLENGQYLSSDLLIGTVNNTTAIPLVGGILGFVSSTAGYLMFVIIPILAVFGYEIHILKKEQQVQREK